MTKEVISYVSRSEVEFSFRRQASLETQRKEKEAENGKSTCVRTSSPLIDSIPP
jgi:hypothetical protein